MPIYEYECKACGHRQEAIQKMSDDPLLDCPVCNKPELKKLISAAAFRLKGGGWYETDFKGGKKKNVVKSETAEKSSPAKPKPSGSCGSGGCGCH
jgi:putative FmdB family regulatory protein